MLRLFQGKPVVYHDSGDQCARGRPNPKSLVTGNFLTPLYMYLNQDSCKRQWAVIGIALDRLDYSAIGAGTKSIIPQGSRAQGAQGHMHLHFTLGS